MSDKALTRYVVDCSRYIAILVFMFLLGGWFGYIYCNERSYHALVWTLQRWCPQVGSTADDHLYCRNGAWRVFYVADLFEAPDAPLHVLKRTP